jgi:hypothetical protein
MSLVNAVSFIKIFQGEETRFRHMYAQFNADLVARAKQAKKIVFNIV